MTWSIRQWGMPAATVRSWLRRARADTPALRRLGVDTVVAVDPSCDDLQANRTGGTMPTAGDTLPTSRETNARLAGILVGIVNDRLVSILNRWPRIWRVRNRRSVSGVVGSLSAGWTGWSTRTGRVGSRRWVWIRWRR